MFRATRNSSLVVWLIVAIATPATLALSAYQLTGDPRLRPLALTVERMAGVTAPPADLAIQVEVHWMASNTQTQPALEFAQHIKRALLAKGHDAWVVVLRDPTATSNFVLYRVGHNVFGPFSFRRAPDGIEPAVMAYRATRRSRGLPEVGPP